MDKRIAVIGSGNVAEALCRALREASCPPVQVFARNPLRGCIVAETAGCPFENEAERLAEADIYLLAVSDRAIREVSERLDFGNAVVAHTSGSCGSDELSPKVRRRGVFYPLQTFTAGRRVNFREVPLFVEADDEKTREEIGELARKLSDTVLSSDPVLRRRLHVAAVFVCNFVNHLYVTGESIMREAGLDWEILKPLIRETTAKMLESPSPLPLQTGPAVREDLPTLEKHRELLRDEPHLLEIYDLLTRSIIASKKKK